MTITNKQETISNIIAKCWADEDFKAKIQLEPQATIEKFIGKKLDIPVGKKIVVVDQTDDSDTIYFNIPAEPALDELELSDEQLMVVSGGATPASPAWLALAAGFTIAKHF